jgi:hypothetical protein
MYGGADSANFGTLAANSSYWFQIYISAAATTPGLELGALVRSTGAAPTYNVIRTNFKKVTDSSTVTIYGFYLSGTIKTTGAALSLVVRVIDSTGDSAGGSTVFSGTAYIAKVGNIN